MTNGYGVAVLSGKGGTGKTLVSVNLAAAAESAVYVDCDVEEPNGHLFWKPEQVTEEAVSVPIPWANPEKCSGCRTCVEFCKYNALAYIGGKVKVFEDVCHSCGGCALLCPANAIEEKDVAIGRVQKGTSQNVHILTGLLNTGEASGVPIIKDLLSQLSAHSGSKAFIDCPPGSACVVMESIQYADYCILVAEPTVFGAHNLEMVYNLVRLFEKPYGVVLNKCLDGPNPSEDLCIKNHIPIIGRIPFDSELGEINSNARIAARESPRYREVFTKLLQQVEKEVSS